MAEPIPFLVIHCQVRPLHGGRIGCGAFEKVRGKQVARELRLIMNIENISLDDLLIREQQWYEMHTELTDPSRIVDQILFGTQLDA